MPRDLSPLLPENVEVRFPARRCAGKPSGGFPDHYSLSVALSEISFTDPTIDPKPLGVAGATHAIRSTALALFSTAAGPPTNESALDLLAQRIAQDFYDWRSQGYDLNYNGIAALAPTALDDVIEFRYDAVDQTTRVRSQPWNGEPVELQHQDPAVSDCQDSVSTPVDDRTPGVLVDIPGGASGQSLRGVLAIEDGRLVMAYDRAEALVCGCSCTGAICVTVKDCNNALATGAVVTVTKGTLSADCTVADQVVSVTRTAGGSGYTSAPTVSFPGAGGSGATATAAIASKCCVSGLATGTYTVTATLGGSTTSTTVDVTGCATFAVTLTLNYRICMTARADCESLGSDAVLTITQGGTTIGSASLPQFTDTTFPGDTAKGCVGVPGPGSYSWSVSHPDYLSPRTGSVAVVSGTCQANVTAQFGDPDALGRFCACSGTTGACPLPNSLPETMDFSDGFGTVAGGRFGSGWFVCFPSRSGGDWARTDPPSPPTLPPPTCVLQPGTTTANVQMQVACDRFGPGGGLEYSATLAVSTCSAFDPATGFNRVVLYPEFDICGAAAPSTFIGSDAATPGSCNPLAATLNFTVPPDQQYDPIRSIYGNSFSITMSEP